MASNNGESEPMASNNGESEPMAGESEPMASNNGESGPMASNNVESEPMTSNNDESQPMASTNDESEPAPKKRKSWYTQGFANKWLSEPSYKCWLAEVKKFDEPSSAKCRICDCYFKNPNKSALDKHGQSAKHRKNMERPKTETFTFNMELPQKHAALLFCHPSMEDLAMAIADRCSHALPPAEFPSGWGMSQLGGWDLPFLERRMGQPHVDHQPVQFCRSIQWEKFKDGWPNLFVDDVYEIAGRDVIFIGNFRLTDTIFEQLSILYSIPRYLARSFKFIIPYFPTGNLEKVDIPGKVATGKTLAMMLSAIPPTTRGPTQIVMFDIHELQERFFFSDQVIPRLESALPLLVRELMNLPEEIKPDLTIAFPDEGACKRFHNVFEGFRMVICTRVREGDERVVTIKEGDPKDKHVIIVDDLVQTGGTIKECCRALLSRGAASVSAFATHAVFPQDSWMSFTTAFKKLSDPDFRHFWITDSIPHAKDICKHPPFKLISLCDMISEALLGYDLLQCYF